MSDYQLFLQERDQIDFLIQKGYKSVITENLNGAILVFEKKGSSKKEDKTETLHITTANARKYFAVKFIIQQQGHLIMY